MPSRLFLSFRSHGAALVLALVFTVGCGPQIQIIQWPISFSESRVRMTKGYMKERYGLSGRSVLIQPRMIVVHWTAMNSLNKSFRAFNRERLHTNRKNISKYSHLNVSTHFLVARDGTIYQLMPESWFARHVIGLNYYAIGIENVGGEGGRQNLTAAQLKSNALLVRYLVHRYPKMKYLIGHYEYRKFERHSYFLERDPKYRTVKTDPGRKFMKALRAKVGDLGLKEAP